MRNLNSSDRKDSPLTKLRYVKQTISYGLRRSLIFVSSFKIIRVNPSTKYSNWLSCILTNSLKAFISRLISWIMNNNTQTAVYFPMFSSCLWRGFLLLIFLQEDKVNALLANILNNEQRFQRKKNKNKINAHKILASGSAAAYQVYAVQKCCIACTWKCCTVAPRFYGGIKN